MFCLPKTAWPPTWASPASADIISFDLTTPNAAILTAVGPYATVTISRTSTTSALITFTSLTNGGFLYMMGDGGTADLNVNKSDRSHVVL